MYNENIKNYIKKEQELINHEYEIIESLSKLRKVSNLSQREVANLISIKQPALVKIEKGNNSPQLNTILKILDVYGYTLEVTKKDIK